MSDDGYWIYQIVQYKDGSGFGLHEVYYNANDEPWGRADDPEVLCIGPGTEDDPVTAEGLRWDMALMLADAIRHDVLEEPEEWAECPFQDALDEMGKEMGGLPDEVEADDLEHDGRREEEPEPDAL